MTGSVSLFFKGTTFPYDPSLIKGGFTGTVGSNSSNTFHFFSADQFYKYFKKN